MQTDPKFTDGLSAILNPILECLNIAGVGTTYQRYDYLSCEGHPFLKTPHMDRVATEGARCKNMFVINKTS